MWDCDLGFWEWCIVVKQSAYKFEVKRGAGQASPASQVKMEKGIGRYTAAPTPPQGRTQPPYSLQTNRLLKYYPRAQGPGACLSLLRSSNHLSLDAHSHSSHSPLPTSQPSDKRSLSNLFLATYKLIYLSLFSSGNIYPFCQVDLYCRNKNNWNVGLVYDCWKMLLICFKQLSLPFIF